MLLLQLQHREGNFQKKEAAAFLKFMHFFIVPSSTRSKVLAMCCSQLALFYVSVGHIFNFKERRELFNREFIRFSLYRSSPKKRERKKSSRKKLGEIFRSLRLSKLSSSVKKDAAAIRMKLWRRGCRV